MTREAFCAFLMEDIQLDFRRRQSRSLCSEIGGQLPGRDILSVTRHLVKRYSTETFESTWTAADDATLKKLVAEKGKQWTVIAEQMGRPADLTRLRYRDYVSVKARNKGHWDESELETLYHTVISLLEQNEWTEELGMGVDVVSGFIDWGTVSLKVGRRSRLQCRDKWAIVERWRKLVTERED
jgi:hypothetical protein